MRLIKKNKGTPFADVGAYVCELTDEFNVTGVKQSFCVMQSYTGQSREQKHQGNRMLYYVQNADMLQASF